MFAGFASHTSVARHILRLLCVDRPKAFFYEGRLWVYGDTHWQPFSGGEQRRLVQDLDGVRVGKKRLAANKSFIDGVLNELYSMCKNTGFFVAHLLALICVMAFLA